MLGNRSLDEQELGRKCLSLSWKLTIEKKYTGDSLKVSNLNFYHNQVEVNISE